MIYNYNKEIALKNFRRILRYRTVAGNKVSFIGFREGIKEMYPNIHSVCDFELIGKSGLMYKWSSGFADEKSRNSIVLMSHYDVVPADKAEWKHPPFGGKEVDGKVYGRGTLDTKCTFCAVMESVEALISAGFTPSYDIYLCFGGDEETTGDDAVQIAEHLRQKGVRAELVLDEGGAVVNGAIAGINKQVALVGIAEKGYMDVEFITYGAGGHTSLVGAKNPITTMSEVIGRLNQNLFKPRWSAPLKTMLDSAAEHTDIKAIKLISRFPMLGGILRKAFIKKLPEVDALTRTIGAITRISGGSAENVIPEEVRAVGNFRVINESSVDETMAIIKSALSGLDVEVNLLSGLEPSVISETSGAGWEALSAAISKTWDNSVLIPYLMLARSDSRSYGIISDNIYRFTPVIMTGDDRRTIHGVDENISVENFYKMIEFYLRLITQENL